MNGDKALHSCAQIRREMHDLVCYSVIRNILYNVSSGMYTTSCHPLSPLSRSDRHIVCLRIMPIEHVARGECHQDAHATNLLRLHGQMYTVTIGENVHTTHRQPNTWSHKTL